MMGVVSKLMDFAFKVMGVVSKLMDFVFKMVGVVSILVGLVFKVMERGREGVSDVELPQQQQR